MIWFKGTCRHNYIFFLLFANRKELERGERGKREIGGKNRERIGRKSLISRTLLNVYYLDFFLIFSLSLSFILFSLSFIYSSLSSFYKEKGSRNRTNVLFYLPKTFRIISFPRRFLLIFHSCDEIFLVFSAELNKCQ